MTTALHTLGIAACVLAGLVFSLWLIDYLGHESDTRPATALSALDRFRQEGSTVDASREQVSPLIRQAQALALYLNPPRDASVPRSNRALLPREQVARDDVPAAPAKPASSSPKFELHGISYYRAQPDRSMALICEPGGTRRWVRQGAQWNHIVIERIDADSILYREGTSMHAVALASPEALTRFARDRITSTPPPAPRPVPSRPAPRPVRGLRQMPPARAAAKLGASLSGWDLPDGHDVPSP